MDAIFHNAIENLLKQKKHGRFELHTHTTLSDGELLPMELIRRCEALGDSAVVISDHASFSNYHEVIAMATKDCEVATREMGIVALPGVELTHVPPNRIAEIARMCKEEGALIVLVHGETIIEPVPKGTNRAAIESPDVDILAHPGLLDDELAALAKKTETILEITSRKGHCYTNGLVFKIGSAHGCSFVIDTDAHSPHDLIDMEFARTVGRGAGMGEEDLKKALADTPMLLLTKAILSQHFH